MAQINTLSVIDSFYRKNVFITGVTGFLGKSILEKLLRETSNIGKIYVLIRPSGDKKASDRLDTEVFQSQLFDVLKHQFKSDWHTFLANKVYVVEGDMTRPQYGLQPNAFKQLANDVDLVINSAASVDFREPMDQALSINTLSVKNILRLCECRKDTLTPIKVTHVSTCYVNGFNQGVIKETVLPSASGLIVQKDDDTFEVESTIKALEDKIQAIYRSNADAQKQQKQLIQLGIKQSHRHGWNDTYTFTKWLAEQLLIQGLNKQNLAIVRPSIIESSISSPVAGWVEGVKVADALIYAYAKGRVSIFPGDGQGVLDVIPVDLVSNSVLMASAQLMTEKGGFHIYQCCSGELNPIRLKDFIAYTQQASMAKYKTLPKLFAGKPQASFKTVDPKIFGLYMFGLKLGTWLRTITGRILRSSKAQSLMQKANTTASLAMIFGFYTAPKYRFANSNLQSLQALFSEKEQRQFNALADCFDWKHYLQEVHLPGLHQYALADKGLANKTKKHSRKLKAAA